jgi:hypothetical protein
MTSLCAWSAKTFQYPQVPKNHDGWLVYSCCSHLERRPSVKRFVSLQFLNLKHSVGLLGRVISPSQGRYLTQTQNKHKQTCMARVGFEPTIPAFERTKTGHDLDRAANVINKNLTEFKQKILTMTPAQCRMREEYQTSAKIGDSN